MKYIIKTENSTGLEFDTASDLFMELVTMIKATLDNGGSWFEIEVSTDAGEFVIDKDKWCDYVKDED